MRMTQAVFQIYVENRNTDQLVKDQQENRTLVSLLNIVKKKL